MTAKRGWLDFPMLSIWISIGLVLQGDFTYLVVEYGYFDLVNVMRSAVNFAMIVAACNRHGAL